MAELDEIKKNIIGKSVLYIDECGAGPLCGDLIVCGVILNHIPNIEGVTDSKKISEKKRNFLFPKLIETVNCYHIERISPNVIDDINIRNARLLGFFNVIQQLKTKCDYIVIDGNMLPKNIDKPMDYLIKGDLLLSGLSIASIIGKVIRDNEIIEIAKKHPYNLYSLDKHKGYGTKNHMEALEKHGPILGFHRISYKPVAKYLNIKET
jgi:ribonuclease HII